MRPLRRPAALLAALALPITGIPGQTPGGGLTFPAPVQVELEPTAPREVPVFWLLGQSNAAGPGAGFWLANPFSAGGRYQGMNEQVDLWIWWPGDSNQRPASPAAWETFKCGFFLAVNNSSHFPIEGGFGPEASFGHAAVRALGEPVFLFKFTRIAALQPDDPVTFSKRPDRETVYDEMFAEWHRARTQLLAAGRIPVLRGVLWVQGENDLRPGYADSYGRHLARFVADLRADVRRQQPDNGPVRFVVSEMHDRHIPRSYYAVHETALRNGQLQAVRAVPDCALAEVDDLPLDLSSGNLVHFDSLGIVLLGQRMFAAWRSSDRDR
jgi:hypothetical protein